MEFFAAILSFWKFPIGNFNFCIGVEFDLEFIGNLMEIMMAIFIGNFIWNLKLKNIKVKSKKIIF
jgi:hypothetical protein